MSASLLKRLQHTAINAKNRMTINRTEAGRESAARIRDMALVEIDRIRARMAVVPEPPPPAHPPVPTGGSLRQRVLGYCHELAAADICVTKALLLERFPEATVAAISLYWREHVAGRLREAKSRPEPVVSEAQDREVRRMAVEIREAGERSVGYLVEACDLKTRRYVLLPPARLVKMEVQS